MNIFLTGGVIGMILVLTAFIQEQRGRWRRTQAVYDGVNFIGSALLVIYGWYDRVWPFVILNGIWALYSLRDLLKDKK